MKSKKTTFREIEDYILDYGDCLHKFARYHLLGQPDIACQYNDDAHNIFKEIKRMIRQYAKQQRGK